MAGILDFPRSKRGEPVWAIAGLYPSQGDWDLQDYLNLETNQLIEYYDGTLEFLPMPSYEHQRIARLLLLLLNSWAEKHGGEVVSAPMPYKVTPKVYREPDLMYIRDPAAISPKQRFLGGAELVVEVVSEGAENRKRDYEDKRKDYSTAGIPEYWIVDPEERLITVLTLRGGKYVEHCKAKPGQKDESALLKGLAVEVSAVLKK